MSNEKPTSEGRDYALFEPLEGFSYETFVQQVLNLIDSSSTMMKNTA